MARKRHSFLSSIQSAVLRAYRHLSIYIGRRGFSQFWTLVLLVGFLTIGIRPVLSQQPEASPLLNQATSAEQLVNEAMNRYEAEDYSTAAALLNRAIPEFGADQTLQQAITLGNLSLVYQKLGDLNNATTAILSSFPLLEGEGSDWQSQVQSSPHRQVSARLLNIYGRLGYVQGNPAGALERWEYASELYAGLETNASQPSTAMQYHKQWLTSRLNEVQALQTLGSNLQSCKVLTEALDLNEQETLLDCQNDGSPSFTKEEPDFGALVTHVEENIFQIYQLNETEEASIWQGLGGVLRVLGRLDDSREVLKTGLRLAVEVTPQDSPVAQLKTFHDHEDTPKKADILTQKLPQLKELYLNLGNTLTAMGELERDRQNSTYENAKSFAGDFDCFSQEANTDDPDDTVAELYQRAALCYQEALPQEENSQSRLLTLQIQLNRLNLSIDHLKWLIEDAPILEATSQEDKTDKGELDLDTAIQEQTKTVHTQIRNLDCLRSRIDQLPAGQAKIYARLNLARNLITYLELQVDRKDAGFDVSQLIPNPSQVESILTTPPPATHSAICDNAKSLSSARFDDLTQTGGQSLWGDVAYLLTTAQRESQELYEQWLVTPINQKEVAAENILENQLLGNKRLESQATGDLGYLYEILGAQYAASLGSLGTQALAVSQDLFQQSESYTLAALQLAQPDKASDIAYRWQWQLGRLLRRQGLANHDAAISAYQAAVDSLTKARKDLSTIDSEAQFSFRDNVEPVYRELMGLLLQSEPGEDEPTNQANLETVIDNIGELQLAELQNFLRCNVPNLTPVGKIEDPTAAIIHSVLHGDSLTLIVKLPGQDLIPKTIPIDQQEAKVTVEKLFNAISSGNIGTLEDPDDTNKERDANEESTAYKEGEKVYSWLIEPIRDILEENVKDGTLVFVLDSFLRKTPVAFLNDAKGGHFLIQDYAIAFAPRQEINRSVVERRNLRIFTGGVGVGQPNIEGKSLTPIKLLEEELHAISSSGIAASEPLLNKSFTLEKIAEVLQSGRYSAAHFKTHSEFSSNPNKTFIAAYDRLIKPNDLRKLIQVANESRGEPLDLLVLSACSAAQGDDRAVLGLAGIAAVTGTRSAVSALWKAEDTFNTMFMEAFYQALSVPGTTKAKALQKAQIEFIGQDQQNWSNYILVGDWR